MQPWKRNNRNWEIPQAVCEKIVNMMKKDVVLKMIVRITQVFLRTTILHEINPVGQVWPDKPEM